MLEKYNKPEPNSLDSAEGLENPNEINLELETEIEPELKKKIEVIRNFETTRQAKALIILVLLGEKPVSVFDLKDEQAALTIIKCKSIDLPVLITKELKEEDDDPWGYQLAVSKSKELVQEIYDIIQKGTNNLDHRRFGELMGYPETAIQAFIEGDKTKLVDTENYLKIAEKFWQLFGFRISKENQEEEIKFLMKWHDLILKHAPELLD